MKKFLVSLAVAALALPTFAQSAPARVAVIDVNKVLMNSTVGKTAYERLKKMQDDRVAQAETQLTTAEAQATNLGILRAQLEHAIAMLIGKPASGFSIPTETKQTTPPSTSNRWG